MAIYRASYRAFVLFGRRLRSRADANFTCMRGAPESGDAGRTYTPNELN